MARNESTAKPARKKVKASRGISRATIFGGLKDGDEIPSPDDSTLELLMLGWGEYAGKRLTTTATGGSVYVVMHGTLRAIPDNYTHGRLFSTEKGIEVNDFLCKSIPLGSPIQPGACIVRGAKQRDIYLLEGGLRYPVSLATASRFSFRTNFDVDDYVLKSIPASTLEIT
jgi:hypothetical protein